MKSNAQITAGTDQYVIFTLDAQRYALHLTVVERINRAVAVTPVPNAAAQMLGIVNIHGRITPAVSMRRVYGFPERELAVSDQLIIVRT